MSETTAVIEDVMGKSIAAAIIFALLAITVTAHLMTKCDPPNQLARDVLEAQFSGSYDKAWDSLAPNVQQMYADTASASESAAILRKDFGPIRKMDFQSSGKACSEMRSLLGNDLVKYTWRVEAKNKSFKYCLFIGDDGKIKAFRIRSLPPSDR